MGVYGFLLMHVFSPCISRDLEAMDVDDRYVLANSAHQRAHSIYSMYKKPAGLKAT